MSMIRHMLKQREIMIVGKMMDDGVVFCFDLQNVITCPRVDIFFLQKEIKCIKSYGTLFTKERKSI